MEMRTIANN